MKKIIVILLTGCVMCAHAQEQATKKKYITQAELEDSTRIDQSYTLGDIVVNSQRPVAKVKADRVEYRASEDPAQKTQTVLEMLRKVPMVTVEGRKKIKVNGSESFKVYVDGKLNLMMTKNAVQIFKNMPAAQVSKIEVVTNPGAEYDAEGAGGILCLTTSTSKELDAMEAFDVDGVQGSLRLNGATNGYGAGGFLSVQKGKFQLTADVDYGVEHDNKSRGTDEQTMTDGTQMVMTTQGKNKSDFGMGSLNANYEIDSLRTLSASMGFELWGERMDGTSHYDFMGVTTDGTSHSKMSMAGINGSLGYQRKFAGRPDRLTMLYIFSTNPSKDKAHNDFSPKVPTFDTENYFTDGNTRATEHILQTDYMRQLAKGHKLELGLKYAFERGTSDSRYYLTSGGSETFVPELSIDYVHDRHVAAAYAQYAMSLKHWEVKTGLRYEHTFERARYHLGNGDPLDVNYGTVVPSAVLTYNVNDAHNWGLAYNMRIHRPGIEQLNPFVNRSMVTQVSYGNPNLDVERINNLALTYNLMVPRFVMGLSVRYNYCGNSIQQYSFRKDNVMHTTYGNVARNNRLGLNANINWSMTSTTRINATGEVAYTDLRSATLNAHNYGWHTSWMLGIQQELPWGMELGANVMDSSKSYTLQGWEGGFNFASLSISQTFLHERLELSLEANTHLRKHGDEWRMHTQTPDFTSYSAFKFPSQSIMMTITWNFGKTHDREPISSLIPMDNEQRENGGRMKGHGRRR